LKRLELYNKYFELHIYATNVCPVALRDTKTMVLCSQSHPSPYGLYLSLTSIPVPHGQSLHQLEKSALSKEVV